MFRLVCLGGLRLEDDSGPVEGRASQRRRLALLALLATPPGEVLTRDKLVGYLWPERGQDRARALLSSALYDLRRELGEDVIRAPGHGVAVNPDRLTSDAALFTDALESGNAERAVELYGGPFLDGVYLSNTPAFDHWLTTTRQRFHRAFRKALEAVARERTAAGDGRGAADAWHRLVVEDPTSTRVAIGYMKALAATGNRAKAIEFGREVHIPLLREEYGAEPDPQVVELLERLRMEPEAVGGPTSGGPTPGAGEERDAATEGATRPALGVGRAPPPFGSGHEKDETDETSPTTGLAAEKDDPRPAGLRPRAGLGRRLRVAAVLLAVALPLAAAWLAGRGAGPEAPIAVAVLPFDNLGGEANEYFGDGLTEEILNALARLDQFRVPARTSAFAFRGRPAEEVGRELDVGYVLTGTVRKEEDSLRVSVSLANTETGYREWGQSYDRRLGSVFAVQEGIARSVVEALLPRLAGELPSRLVPVPENPEAQDVYWKARAYWHERTPESLQQALVQLQRAIALDSTYALAYAGIADVYNLLGAYEYGVLPPEQAYSRARAAAEQALRWDEELADGHAALANYLFNYAWDWDRAEREYEQAIALNPGFAMAHHWYALLLRAERRNEEALAQVRRAREIDPRSPTISTSLARHYYFLGETDRAIREFRDGALTLDSTFVLAHLGLGMAAIQRGEPDVALGAYAAAEQLLGRSTPVVTALTAHALGTMGESERARALYEGLEAAREGTYVAPHYLAVAAIGLGLHDEAISWFEAALEERSGAIIYLRLEPIVDPLRDLPAFHRLMERAVEAGLPSAAGGPV